MTLPETVNTIQKWIKSCDKPEQLSLLLKVIEDYVTIQRIPFSTHSEIIDAKTYLLQNIQIQSRLFRNSEFPVRIHNYDYFFE